MYIFRFVFNALCAPMSAWPPPSQSVRVHSIHARSTENNVNNNSEKKKNNIIQ